MEDFIVQGNSKLQHVSEEDGKNSTIDDELDSNENPSIEQVWIPSEQTNESDNLVSLPSYVPPNLMGRDLNDPAKDWTGRLGRPVQKPRFGVKVPYRNLTSQIVSRDEIAQVILERSLKKFHDVPEESDVFAMMLKRRLAKTTYYFDQTDKEKEKTELESPKINNTVTDILKKPVCNPLTKSIMDSLINKRIVNVPGTKEVTGMDSNVATQSILASTSKNLEDVTTVKNSIAVESRHNKSNETTNKFGPELDPINVWIKTEPEVADFSETVNVANSSNTSSLRSTACIEGQPPVKNDIQLGGTSDEGTYINHTTTRKMRSPPRLYHRPDIDPEMVKIIALKQLEEDCKPIIRRSKKLKMGNNRKRNRNNKY